MELNKLKDNYGAKMPKKRVGRGVGSGLGKTSGKVIKARNLDLVCQLKALKVVKCQFIEDFLKGVLTNIIEKSIEY